jgi:CheY-like chemotaxis protein
MSRRVLIVDDDDDIREALAELLRQEGFEVVEARDGHGALKMMTAPAPDVILLDLSMPNMDGWEFRDAMLKSNLLTQVPVIVMTAAQERVRAPIEATEIVNKPFVIEDLLAAIRRSCNPKNSPVD